MTDTVEPISDNDLDSMYGYVARGANINGKAALSMIARIRAQDKKNARLREALKPFAVLAEIQAENHGSKMAYVNNDYLNAARAALSPQEGE